MAQKDPKIPTAKDGCVWLTGASSGIGRATALRLAKAGWAVAVTARSGGKLEALRDEAAKLKGSIHPYPGDTTDRDAMEGIVAAIEEEVAPIALALFNAGIYEPIDAAAPKVEDFIKSFTVNLNGTVYGLVPVVNRMVARGKGHIAITSSVTGYGGLPTSGAYGATKAALINLAECLQIELWRHGVRASIINPGFVETPAQDDNDFPKPFMVSADRAAREIVRGLKRGRFEITFPRRFTWPLGVMKWCHRGLYCRLIRKQTGWDKLPEEGGSTGPSRSG